MPTKIANTKQAVGRAASENTLQEQAYSLPSKWTYANWGVWAVPFPVVVTKSNLPLTQTLEDSNNGLNNWNHPPMWDAWIEFPVLSVRPQPSLVGCLDWVPSSQPWSQPSLVGFLDCFLFSALVPAQPWGIPTLSALLSALVPAQPQLFKHLESEPADRCTYSLSRKLKSKT